MRFSVVFAIATAMVSMYPTVAAPVVPGSKSVSQVPSYEPTSSSLSIETISDVRTRCSLVGLVSQHYAAVVGLYPMLAW